MLDGLAALVLHATLMLVGAPLLAGLIRWGQARLAGRAGPSPLQPYRELRRLCRKQPVMPESASTLFTAAPIAALAATIVAALLTPSFTLGMATEPLADLVVIAGLLASGGVALAMGAVDAGTASGGAGVSRGTPAAVAAASGVLLAIFVVALLTGTTNLDAAAAQASESGLRPPLLLAFAAMLMAAAGDGDERSLPDHSGRLLAVAEAACMLRKLTWFSLLVAAFMPFGIASTGSGLLGWLGGLAAWALKIGLLAGAFAAFRALRASMPLARHLEFLGMAALLSLLAAVLAFISQGLA